MLRITTTCLAAVLAQGLFALSVDLDHFDPHCTYNDGWVGADVSGGVPPYSYTWSNGANTSSINGLVAGYYEVTVTDFEGTVVTESRTLIARDYEHTASWVPGCPWSPGYAFIPGTRHQVGVAPLTLMPGWGAYLYTYMQMDSVYFIYPDIFPGEAGTTIDVTYTDANGCAGTIHYTVPDPLPWQTLQVMNVEGACSGGANGLLEVHAPAFVHPHEYAYEVELHHSIYGPLAWVTPYGTDPAVSYADVRFFTHGVPAGEVYLVQRPNWSNTPMRWYFDDFPAVGCADTVEVMIPDLGYTCGTVSGTAFMDYDENCTLMPSETRVPEAIVQFEPGGYVTNTDEQGRYWMNLPYGTYTMEQPGTEIDAHCIDGTTSFTLDAGDPTVTMDLADTSLVPLDVWVHSASAAARPGFLLTDYMTVENLTPAASGTYTLTFTFDGTAPYVSAWPAPTSVTSNTVTWTLFSLGAFQYRDFEVRRQVPPDIGLVGTTLLAQATVGTTNTDAVPGNNTSDHAITVTASLDPNDKVARTSSGLSNTQYFLDQDGYIDYTIRFQNTGNDTAFAVVIVDTLPPQLDPATFIAGARSHPGTVHLSGQGVLRFMVPDALLPDSNVNEPASHGLVSFRIKPRTTVMPGDLIINSAGIYFDYNPPVITEPSVLVVDVSTAVVEVNGEEPVLYPQPVRDRFLLRGLAPGRHTLTLFAADGRLHGHLMADTDGTVPAAHLAPGVYLLQVQTADGMKVVRFVKE